MTEALKSTMSRAVDASNLQNRIKANSQYATNDFEGWSDELLASFNCVSVLDLCCGTGNQILKLTKHPSVKSIVGIDISQEALDVAAGRISSTDQVKLINCDLDKLDECLTQKDNFDLITCFYGLYYAKQASRVLKDLDKHLNQDGSILIVGPHGNNNRSIFDLLEKYFKIEPFVKFCSANFMSQIVVPTMQKMNYKITKKYFVNKIQYPSPESVLEYWKSSIFYKEKVESAVMADLQKHFKNHNNFVVEKHIMACIGTKS